MTRVWHIVLFRTQSEAMPTDVAEVRGIFASAVGACDGLEWVRAGTNHSASPFAGGWTEAVIMQFRDRAARDAYLAHPLHEAASRRARHQFYTDVVVFDADIDADGVGGGMKS